MRFILPTSRRLKLAGTAFVLTLATTTILWNQGRKFGKQEALQPTAAPMTAPSIFTEPVTVSYAQKLAALRAKLPWAKTAPQKQALAGEFLVLGLGAHFRNEGEGKLSLAAYDEALALFLGAADRQGQAGVLMNRATTIDMLGKTKEAEEGLRTALEIYTSLPAMELQQAEVLFRLGERLGAAGHYDEARRVLDRSLRIRQKKAEVHGQGDCLAALGQLAYEEGQGALARQLLGEASQLYVRCGDAGARGAVLGQLGDVALAEGEFAEAEKLYGEGLAIWRKADQGYWVGRFLARQASLALKQEKLDEAERLAQESLKLLESSNSPTSVAWPLTVLGAVYGKRGEGEKAQAALSHAREQHRLRGRAFGLRLVEQISL